MTVVRFPGEAATDRWRPAEATRGPWDAAAYPEVGTVLATYGIQPPSLVALAAVLLGDAPAGGRCPVRPAVDPG